MRAAVLLLLKADIPPGARWITVRPNGPGTEGHPVLIQPAGNGAYRVIGGAGGKLNYLKLTGVRSEAEYAARQKEAAKARREERKRQAAADRAAGIAGAKAAALNQLRLSAKAARDEFISKVAKVMEWDAEKTRFRHEDYQDRPAAEVDALAEKHFAKLYEAAREAAQMQKQRLLHDAEARRDVAIPLTAPPDDPAAISVADLDPVSDTPERGLGFVPHYAERAAAAGATPEAIAAEAAAVTGKEPRAKADKDKSTGAKIGDALEALREPIPGIDPAARMDAKRIMEVLRAEREMREKVRQIQKRIKEIESAKTADEVQEAGAFVIETDGKVVDEQIARAVEDDLRTIRTRGFLAEAAKAGATELPKHLGIGAYNAVNSLALATTGAALMDRSVVDVLGPAAAAQAIVHRLASDLPEEEITRLREAMGRYHVEHYMARSRDALAEAAALQEEAAEISLGEAASGDDLALAAELNQRRREMVNRSRAILAQALGEMETNAAIVAALEKPVRDRITVPMGDISPVDAITRLRAIGLDQGDYRIERAGKNTILTINGSAIGKLASPVSAEDVARVARNLRIMSGAEDEEDWLPEGVARRPEFRADAPIGVAPRLARAFPQRPNDIDQAIRDYIGGRAADGDPPADILAGLLTEENMQRSGDRAAFMAAVNRIAPLYDDQGKMIRAEAHAETFERLADEFASRTYGTARAPIHRQTVPEDDKTVEALHQALAATPEGVLAFRPVGDLSPQDQGALRAFFAREFGHTDPLARELRERLAKIEAEQPEKETDGLFGRQINPEWTRWKQQRDEAAAAASGAELTWARYVEIMGGPEAAYEAMQDVIRGRVMRAFADMHNRLRPEAPVRVGRTVIRHDLSHLDALDPEARKAREAEHARLVDRLRNRVAGRYAAGSVLDKIAAAREAEEAANQAQMGLFGDEPTTTEDGTLPEDTSPLKPGERWTVGHAAERILAGVAARTGRMWKPGQPVKLYRPTMSGRFAARQRAVKLIAANKRMVLGMGVGSGKTSIMLSAFTHQKAKGEVKRGLFLVPSVVQGQFHGEALTLLEPGRHDWHANPGAGRDERIRALKDAKHDFVVLTHQAFRDDVLHLAASHAGVPENVMADRIQAMSREERAELIRDTLAREGIEADYVAVDEGHNLLNRQGKANSQMADIIDAVSDSASHYVLASADPVKNDASEVFDTLRKMEPNRYRDRDAFLRRYGVDTEAAKDGLRRELARHYYTASIASGVRAHRRQDTVPLHPKDRARIEEIQRAAGAARLAKMEGRVDIAAMRTLSPDSFADQPEEQHENIARRLQDAIGVVRDAALRRAITGQGKIDALAKIAAERKGRPGVIFAHHIDTVEAVAERLRQEGHRVATMTGKHGAKDKDRIKREFARRDHDILICSDAGLIGANLQTGKWLVQMDTPMTAMAHAQRNGRIDRIGQTEDVELIDLLADHPEERIARDRLARKYGLRDIVTSPLDSLDDTGLAGLLARLRAGQTTPEPDLPDETPTDAERARAAAADAEQKQGELV